MTQKSGVLLLSFLSFQSIVKLSTESKNVFDLLSGVATGFWRYATDPHVGLSWFCLITVVIVLELPVGLVAAKSWGTFTSQQNVAKCLFNWQRWCVTTLAADKDILCVVFQEFPEPDEIGVNMCFYKKTVTALAIQNSREHPNQVKGCVETVVPNYSGPKLALHFRMTRQTFQVKDNL